MQPTPSKTGVTPQQIREDYWFGTIQSVVDKNKLSDRFLHNKIRGAEDEIERELGILWQETRIRAEPDPADTDFDLGEPAYDYTADFFIGERWGFLKLRRSPIRSVERIVFSFPNPGSKTFTVPKSWIRIDHDFGFIRLVPDGLSILAPFSGYVLSALSGGRGIPQTINVDYTAGFISGNQSSSDALASSYQDLLEHLKVTVLTNILRTSFLPGTMSTSADGLNTSISLDMKTVIDQQAEQRRIFKNRIKGVVMAVA